METIPAASENAANEAPEPEMTPEEAEEQLFWDQFAGREVQVICLFHAEWAWNIIWLPLEWEYSSCLR